MNKSMIIFFVSDQKKSRIFYEGIFDSEPVLNVLGMTEFKLSELISFGIMPETSIMNILNNNIPNPRLPTEYQEMNYIFL